MLRIQSRLNHVLTELTRTHFHPSRIAAKGTGCSLIQNVTVKVSFQNQHLCQSRKLRRPRFSFFSSSIVKKQTAPKAVTKSTPQTSAQSNKPAIANPLDFFRTSNFVASSAAALVQ
jgi:hypothetical protein